MLKHFHTPILLLTLRICGASSALIMNFLLAKNMSAEEFAHSMAVISFVSVLSVVPFLSLDGAIIKLMREYLTANQHKRLNKYFSFLVQIYCIICLLIFIITLFSSLFGFNKSLNYTLIIALISIPFFAWLRYKSQIGNAEGFVIGSAFGRSFIRPISMLLLVAFYIILNNHITTELVSTFFVASIILALISQYYVLKNTYKYKLNLTKIYIEKHWIKDGFALGTNLLLIEFQIELIIIIASLFIGKAELAILVISLRITGFSKFSITAVDQAFRYKIAKYYSENSYVKLNQQINISTNIRIIFFIIITLILYFILPILANALGNQYFDLTSIVWILHFEIFFLTFFGTPQFILGQSKFSDQLLYINLLYLVVIFMLINIIGPDHNLKLLVIAITIASILRNLTTHIITLKLLKIDGSFLNKYSNIVLKNDQSKG